MGRMGPIMSHRLGRREHFRVVTKGLATIRITVKSRKITTGNLNSDAMTRPELIAGNPHIDVEGIDLTGLEQLFLLHTISIARPNYPFTNVEGLSIRMNIYKLGRKIRIACG